MIEVQNLVKKYGAAAPGLQSIGYQEFIPYFSQEISLDEVMQQIKFNSHRYVRYQSSWFKKDKSIKRVENYTQAKKLVNFFLK